MLTYAAVRCKFSILEGASMGGNKIGGSVKDIRGYGKIVIAVIMVSVFVQGQAILSPILADIARAFPNASDAQVQLVYSLPYLGQLPTLLLCGKINKLVSKKLICIVSTVILLIGGMIPLFFYDSLGVLYAASFIIGLGIGGVNVTGADICFDYFSGPTRTMVIGWLACTFCAGAAGLSFISGLLAKIHWHLSYLTFLMNIPILIVFTILLPERKPEAEEKKQKQRLNGRLIYYTAITCLLFSLLHNAFGANQAMFLAERGLGGSDVSGMITGINFGIGLITGLFLSKITGILGRMALATSVLFCGVGICIVFFAQSALVVALGSVILGIGFAVKGPLSVTIAGNLASENSVSLALSVTMAASNIAYFVSPFVVNAFCGLFGDTVATRFIVSGAGILALAIILILFNPVTREESL